MTALLLIDLQNDFMPGGALPVPEADKILPSINKLLLHPFDLIVASQDWHPKNHVSFATVHGKQPGETILIDGIEQVLWPTHCVQNHKGAQLAPGWDQSKIDVIIHKGTKKNIESYSAFFNNEHKNSTNLDAILKEKKISILYIAGLATDYCVLYSVLDARKLAYETYVVIDACQGVNSHPEDETEALQLMKNAGAHLITTADLPLYLK